MFGGPNTYSEGIWKTRVIKSGDLPIGSHRIFPGGRFWFEEGSANVTPKKQRVETSSISSKPQAA